MVEGDRRTIVSIVQHENVRFAIEEAINLLGGVEKFLQHGDRIVIKPNLVFPAPLFSGWVTDYPIVQAIIELCQQVKPKEIIIAEGSGGNDTELAYRSGGYNELAKRFNVRLVDLHQVPSKKVAVPDGRTVQYLRVPKIILDCDVLINVPKLKLYKRVTEDRDWVSLAVKNLLGAIPGKGRYSKTKPSEFPIVVSPEFHSPEGMFYRPIFKPWFTPRGERLRIHRGLSHGLVDIHMVIKPALNVLDAFVVSNDVNQSAVRGERPFELNTIFASVDPVALDCTVAKLAGIDIVKTIYLKHAADRGIGVANDDQIILLGTPLETVVEAWKAGVKMANPDTH